LKASHVEAGEAARVAVPKKKGPAGRAGAPLRKAPIVGPKRTAPRRAAAPEAPPEPSAATRELALALAAAGLEKKAIGIEILDVSGKVDYADFLVIMTGRSDRHVHAIATGIEEALRSKKVRPLSMEGLQAATWVLIDFSDVVVHVFQEDTRRLYDIEGLWIDAGRVDVPVPPGASSGMESSSGMEQPSSTSDLS
jgi:ribosome-associated protein